LRKTLNGQTTTFTVDTSTSLSAGLNSSLTQALSDGTNTYIYGNGRIAQTQGGTTEYFFGDALGSVRQMANQSDVVTYAHAYDPYGVVTQTGGTGQTAYGFTGEQQSGDLVYLRARYLNVSTAEFISRDTWRGDPSNPISFNHWAYANANPVMNTDPSGMSAQSSLVPTIYNQTSGSIGSFFQNIGGGSCVQWDGIAMSGGAEAVALTVNFASVNNPGSLSDFWLGFWKEAYRVHIWFNPSPSVQEDVAIKSNESTPMLLGRLTADIVSIAIGGIELDTAGLLFMAGPAECVAGLLAGGMGEFITCPGAAVQMAGATLLAGQAVVSGSIAVADGIQILAMLHARNGGGGGGVHVPKPGEATGQGRVKGRKPPSRTSGIYEYIDQKTGKWYVGKSGDLYERLRGEMNQKRFASWDDVVWTEIQTSSDKALRVAERVRYEQIKEMVGGPQNMANDPAQLHPISKVTQWFDEGWDQTVPNWPSWPTRP
jgi:RHS repeat-associated protein